MITAHKNDLLGALRVLRPLVKPLISPLVVISPSNGGVALSVDALTEYASLTIAGSCEDSVALPLPLLERVLQYSEGSEAVIEVVPKKARLKCGATKARLKCGATSAWLPQGELPVLRKFSSPSSRVSADIFLGGLKAVYPVTISQGPSAGYPGIHIGGGILEATDGRALHRINVGTGILGDIDCVLHPEVRQLADIGCDGESVGIVYNGGSFSIHGDNALVSMQPLAYTYPNVQGHVPEPSENILEVDREALMRVLRACNAVLGKSGNVSIYAAYDGVVIETSASELGNVSEMIPITSNKAKSFRIDPFRLLMALNQLQEPVAHIQCDGSEVPISIREGPFTAVIATMRTI